MDYPNLERKIDTTSFGGEGMKEWKYKRESKTGMLILDVDKDEEALEKIEKIVSSLYQSSTRGKDNAT